MLNLTDITSWFWPALAIIVSVIIYYKSKPSRRITCLVYHPLSLINVKEEVKNKIKILYNDKEVNDISMMQINIINNGSLPIKKENIVKPIEFIFDDKTNIIENNILYTDPQDISVECSKISSNRISCNFDLLNPKEEISLQFISLNQNLKQPSIRARIEGIKNISINSFTSSLISETEKDRLFRILTGLGQIFTGLLVASLINTDLTKFMLFLFFALFMSAAYILKFYPGVFQKIFQSK